MSKPRKNQNNAFFSSKDAKDIFGLAIGGAILIEGIKLFKRD